jgi:hypothetical protein
MMLEALAFEGGLAELESLGPAVLVFGHDFPEAFLDQGFQRRFLLSGDLSGLVEQAIWNMYGCFHMADHIIPLSCCQAALLQFINSDASAEDGFSLPSQDDGGQLTNMLN